ncbi:hypothetical protein ACFV4N_37805, partial [Actinosynnema sp. NPDC059797]
MSRTDKTRPRWVQPADAPMVTCVPVHDHRSGVCAPPEGVTADGTSPRHREAGCHWTHNPRRPLRDNSRSGRREWSRVRREDRRRDRHRARRELRAHRAHLGEEGWGPGGGAGRRPGPPPPNRHRAT